MTTRKRVKVWWEALRWKPAYGPERPGFLYRDVRSVPLDKRSRSQLRLAMGNPPINAAASCGSCGARIYAADRARVEDSRQAAVPALWAALVSAQVRAAELLGRCIDCGSPTRPRSNWPAIAPTHRAQQSSFFHRCSRCYVRRQLDAAGGGKPVGYAGRTRVRAARPQCPRARRRTSSAVRGGCA